MPAFKKGHKVSAETRKKLSIIAKTWERTLEYRGGQAWERRGKSVSEETRQRMSEARKLWWVRKRKEKEARDRASEKLRETWAKERRAKERKKFPGVEDE